MERGFGEAQFINLKFVSNWVWELKNRRLFNQNLPFGIRYPSYLWARYPTDLMSGQIPFLMLTLILRVHIELYSISLLDWTWFINDINDIWRQAYWFIEHGTYNYMVT